MNIRQIPLFICLLSTAWACAPADKDDGDSSSDVVDSDDGDSDAGGSGDGDSGDGGSGDGGSDDGGSDDGGSDDGGSDDGGSDDGGSDDGGSDDGGSEDGGSEDGGSEDGGSPLDIDPADLDGYTWDLVLSEGNYTDPPAVGALLAGVFTDSMLLGVTDVGTTTLDMSVAVGTPTGSGHTVGTILPLGEADFSSPPDFEVDGSGSTLNYLYEGVAIPFEDPVFVGEMSRDGSELATVALTARIDTRELGSLFDLTGGESAVCDLVTTFGAECVPCADSEQLCLDIAVDWTNVELAPGISLE
jgi:hypothetical protein